MSEAEKILVRAMKLPASDRARIAAELIASIDGEPDADAEAAWAREIDRRVHELETGGAKAEDWKTVHGRIASRLKRR